MNETSSTLKIIEVSNKRWIYWGEYNLVFQYSQPLMNVLRSYETGISEKEILQIQDDGIKEELRKVFENVEMVRNKRDDLNIYLNSIEKENWDKDKYLLGVLFEVSNDCNLRCTYCYGQGGNYGASRCLMNSKTLKKSLEYCFKRFTPNEKISIVFFGGEPLINSKIIFEAVEAINAFASKNGNTVRYSVTTNGTILNTELLNLFQKNDFIVTVIIDGGELIQNRNRPFATGKGSYDVISKNVEVMLKNRIRLIARITLTGPNIKNLSTAVEDIWNIGFNDVTFELVSTDSEELSVSTRDIDDFKKQINILSDITFNNIVSNKRGRLKKLTDYVFDIRNVKLGQTCSYNSHRGIVISSNGDFYRCHRLLEQKQFCVGNTSESINWERFICKCSYDKYCSGCWGKNICARCAQENYEYTGDLEKPDLLRCEFKKIVMEAGIKLFIRLWIHDNSN